MSSKGRPTQYLARLTDVRQMDAQSALDQMKSLLGSRPHTVYKTAYYRKQTKNHWARDDPAFCVLQAIFLLVSVVAYSVAFKASIGTFLGFLIHSLFWNWLVSGALVCSILREVANRHLTVHQSTSHVRQSVEWLYAFDIHCNAFFPLFCVLYGVQFFLLPLILGNSFLALVVANTLYAVAFSWYWYITHLGYRSLPFLTNTEVFMFPIAAVILLFVLNLVGYPFNFGWNFARVFAQIYLRDE
uniref:UNC-50 family protein n=1 Tax=Grammatophora oceanica TaxID=210454 RepID=A0A7S1Y6X4_9STRA